MGQQQMYSGTYQVRFSDAPSSCIHNNCPVCKKEQAIQAVKVQKELQAIEQKKLDYKNRCKEYMKKMSCAVWRRRL
jgi:hypothetical protein